MIGWGDKVVMTPLAQRIVALEYRVSTLEKGLQREEEAHARQWGMLTSLLTDLGYTYTWEPVQAAGWRIEKKGSTDGR